LQPFFFRGIEPSWEKLPDIVEHPLEEKKK